MLYPWSSYLNFMKFQKCHSMCWTYFCWKDTVIVPYESLPLSSRTTYDSFKVQRLFLFKIESWGTIYSLFFNKLFNCISWYKLFDFVFNERYKLFDFVFMRDILGPTLIIVLFSCLTLLIFNVFIMTFNVIGMKNKDEIYCRL